MNKDKSIIPKGLYCYSYIKDKGVTKMKNCPYWDCDSSKPKQMCGYCHYLELGDWEVEDYNSLLWDQVKECGINDEIDWEEYGI